MRPTGRAVFVFSLGVPLALAIVLAEPGLWSVGIVYLGVAIVLTGFDGLMALTRRALTIDIELPDVIYIGDRNDIDVALTVERRSPGARVEIVCDVSDIIEPPRMAHAPAAAGTTTRVAIPLVARRRGTAVVERLWFRWRGPFGLVSRQLVRTLSAEVAVVPNVRAVRHAAIQFSSLDALFGMKPQSQQGDGSDFDSLRDYSPGLDHRSIDWKHSARHRSLVCKEFRAERNHHIVLAFDTGQLMSEPLGGVPKLDHAINAGLLLGYMSLRGGDRIGLFGFDSQVRLAAEPVGGLQNFRRLQRASAELDYRHEETNFTLGLADLMGRLNRRSLVILLTEFVDTVTAELMVENLERVASRHLVIFVTLRDPSLYDTVDARPDTVLDMTRSVIADEFLRERLVVLERLRRVGIQCIDAPVEHVGVELVNRYLAVKRRELI